MEQLTIKYPELTEDEYFEEFGRWGKYNEEWDEEQIATNEE